MLTKGAIGNLVNRYKAVLKKCNLINTFGSLAVASMLVLGGAGVASADYASQGKINDEIDGATNQLGKGEKIAGGWIINSDTGLTDTMTKNLNTDITITNVTLSSKGDGTSLYENGHIFGANYVKKEETYTLNTAKTTINYAQAEMVVGGQGSSGVPVTFTGGSTILTINDGIFGKEGADTDDPELFVAAGNLIKTWKPTSTISASSQLNSTTMTINGGTFNAAIVGGSVSNNCHDDNSKVTAISGSVSKTFTKITGGTFSHPIVAGGMAFGPNTTSSVTELASIEISGPVNLTQDANIYSGGIEGGWDLNVGSSSDVAKASVSIENATIMNVYGTDVGIDYEKINNKHTWVYTPLDSNSVSPSEVDTELSLTNVTATNVYIPKGTVLLKSASEGKVSISGTLTAETSSAVTVAGDGATNDAIGGDASKLANYISVTKAVDKNGDEFTLFEDETTVNLDAGTIVGAVSGTVTDGVANTTEKPNETNVAMADLPDINHMITRVEMNDLRKRMGDIRLLEGNTGVWARWDGGKLKGDSGLTNDFHKIQAGIDTTTGIDNLRLGAAFSYTNSDMEFAKADAESDTMSLAAYGVWTANNGMFADVIARLAFIDTEIQTDKVKGDLDNIAFSLSGEYGWRFDLCDKFFVEPQLELTYTYVDSDDFTSDGAKFDFDSTDSLIGRAGLAAGWKLPDELGELYARASVVQEFMGDGKLTASMGSTVRHYETDGDDTWFEYGVGANVKVTKNAYIFADVERTEGAEIDEEWRGTVGFRYSF